MPPPEKTYQEAVAEARARLVQGGLVAQVVGQVREALARALVEVQQDAVDGPLTSERAVELRQSLDASLQRFRNRAVVVLEQGRDDAIQLAVQGHTQGLTAVAEQTGAAGTIAVGESFSDVPDLVREVAAARRLTGGAETMATLVNRNVQAAADDIDDAIESAVNRGVSWQRLTKDLTRTLAQGDEDLQEILRRLGRAADVDVVPSADPVSITEEELSRAKRLEYDARRIAVSEINSHYHEADVISAIKSPVVDLLRWKTSQLHTAEKRYVPDVCDFLEESDLYGYGPGLFHPAVAPSLVHPHCQCRYESILKEPEDYGTPNRTLPDEREVSETTVENVMKAMDGDRTVTDRYVETQTKQLQDHLDAARDVADQLVQ